MATKKTPITKLLNWFDQNALAVLAGFLLAFIPLYPKLPLFEAIPGYIVRVRLEDFLILFTVFIWFIQLIRSQAKLHPLLTKIILAYLIVGFLSTLSAIFITQTVPQEMIHIGKLYLHFFRRIEYFSLFFVFYSAIKTKKQAHLIIGILLSTLTAVAIYGYGQKYLYWPVYSTMNREFSKGWKLYLTEHARVPSTFGGHYDAAAFTMALATIALAIFFFTKDKWVKVASLVSYLAGFWLLILTASRTSFIAYLGSVSFLMFLSLFIKNWRWVIPRWLIVIIFSMFVMLSFGDLSERFSQVLGLDKISQVLEKPLFSPKVGKPSDYLTQADLDNVLTPTDELPTRSRPTRPRDVYEDIPEPVKDFDAQGNEIIVYYKDRTFSENAMRFGLSVAIRLDALWPRAIAGFKINPLLGSGYSTLTKEAVGQFTEAESTDNDYLRNLGETGLLGFIGFFGSITAIIVLGFQNLKHLKDHLFIGFTIGLIAATVGLLINAIYIDIFEASKVALTFWGLAGLMLIIPQIESESASHDTKKA